MFQMLRTFVPLFDIFLSTKKNKALANNNNNKQNYKKENSFSRFLSQQNEIPSFTLNKKKFPKWNITAPSELFLARAQEMLFFGESMVLLFACARILYGSLNAQAFLSS